MNLPIDRCCERSRRTMMRLIGRVTATRRNKPSRGHSGDAERCREEKGADVHAVRRRKRPPAWTADHR